MMDQWDNLLPYLLIALAVVILAVLVILRFRRTLLPQSLRNRLPLAFLGVAGVSVGVMILVLAIQIRATLQTQKGNDFLVQAELSGNRLAEQIDNQISRIADVSRDYSVVNQVAFAQKPLDEMSPGERMAHYQEQEATWADPDEAFFRRSLYFNPASVVLSRAAEKLPLYSQIIVTDLYGGLAAAAGEEPEKFYFGNEVWWQAARNSNLENALFLSTPYLVEDGQTVLIDIVMPLLDTQSNNSPIFQGVLRAKLQLSDFAFFTESGLGENIELALLNNTDGMWLFSSKYPQKVSTTAPEGVRENIAQFPLNWGVDPDETGESVMHSHAVLSSSPEQPYLDDLGLTIVLQQPAPDALTSLADFAQPVAIGGGIALLLAGIVGYFIARQISRPIISLSNTAVAMADGQLGQTAEESGTTELKTLAYAFNRMTDQLQQILLGLEQQVASRTERLEIVATLGERLSSILNLDDLLDEVINQIQTSFDYYHAHIYLLDEEQDLVIAAGTGSAGSKMKAQGHSIPISVTTSLVAQSARSGQIVRVDNVRENPDWLPNPLLPETSSEMAVPISLEGKVVGVLDVQQNRVSGLDQGDAALLRSLANQVAVAINNARLFAEVETALAEAREAQRRYIEQAWDASTVARRSAGRVQFSLGESTTLNEVILAKARKYALAQTEPSVITVNEYDETVPDEQLNEGEELAVTVDPADLHHIFVAPIALGETLIGNLQLHEVDPDRQWSEGELALINAVIDQVAQTAENLRLLDETQERASREQLISQVSDKLRRAPDMGALMEVATSEISRVLNPARTFIRFDSKADDALDKNGETAAISENGKSDIEISPVEDDSVVVEEHTEE